VDRDLRGDAAVDRPSEARTSPLCGTLTIPGRLMIENTRDSARPVPFSLKAVVSVVLAIGSNLFPPLTIAATLAAEEQGNSAALIAFFGVLALGVLVVIGSAVTGILALRQTRRGAATGGWLAIVGLVLCTLSGAGHILLALLYLLMMRADVHL